MKRGPAKSGRPVEPLLRALDSVPLFWAAVLFSLGILVTRCVWVRPSVLLLALVGLASLCVLAAMRALRLRWSCLALLWLTLGAWCATMEPHPAPQPQLLDLSDALLRTAEGTISEAGALRTEVEEPTGTSVSQRIDLRLASIEVVNDDADVQQPVQGSVRLTVRWPEGVLNPAKFRCGERIRAAVRLLPPEMYQDAGAWDRAAYLLDQDITSTASVEIDRVERLSMAGHRSWACRLSGMQQDVSARLMALPARMRKLPAPLRLSDDDAAMLSAMITGDRTYLNRQLRVGFERTGSFHMLVVSGLHLAIVAGVFLGLARRLRIPSVPATLLTIVASFAYALFTGFATPVQRSLWMVSLYLVGRLFYRDRSALNTIGFAALCLLAVSPRSLFDAGFQMTLLAVVVIAGVARPLLENTIAPYVRATRDLRRVVHDVKLPPHLAQFRVTLRMMGAGLQRATNRWIAWKAFPYLVRFVLDVGGALVVTCVVELAMALPMAAYFHRLTLFALPVNLLILPLLVVLMPVALAMTAVLVVWPAAGIVPAIATGMLLHIGTWLVHLFGSLAWGDLRIPGPLVWQTALYCVLLAVAMVFAHLQNRWHRRMAWICAIAAACIAMMPRPIAHPAHAMLVQTLDVGQGDSILVITPEGKTMLVDAGGFAGRTHARPQQFDIGEEIVSPALWARGIRHLDVVVLTHAHSDHMGGLPAVLRNFHPAELWVGNNPHIAAYEAMLDEAAALHVRTRSLVAGDALALGSMQMHVLAPLPDYRPGQEPANNDSLVLRIVYGNTAAMLEGDAEAPIEEAMLKEGDLSSAVLKVGHHGSETSSQPAFLARVAPQWAVISCGLHNPYGHPREEVLSALQAGHIRTVSTDINGAACFELDGHAAKLSDACR